MVADDYFEVAQFLSQNANDKNKFKIVSIKGERHSIKTQPFILRNSLSL